MSRPLANLELGKYLGPVVLLCALVLPFMPFSDRYVMDVSILIATYVMLGWGLQVVVGLAGLLDLGYVAFYAVGAYSYALSLASSLRFLLLDLSAARRHAGGMLGTHPGLPRSAASEVIISPSSPWPSARSSASSFSTGMNSPAARTASPTCRGPPFSAFPSHAVRKASPPPSACNIRICTGLIFLYYLAIALALVTFYVTNRLRRLPIGRAWEALREDEVACRSLGLNTTNTKLTAFAIGAMFGGFAGSFFATKQGFISPESFNFLESATILAIVVLGACRASSVSFSPLS